MAANIRCIMRAKANYGAGITKLKVKLTPTQSGTPWKDDTVNNAPYVFRSVPMGNREWNKLVGGTVAWNQLCNSSSVTGTSGHKFYLKKGGAESITNTNTFTGLSNGSDMVTDLTLALGPTLADYVYSLEQSQAGSGIAWLKRYNLIDDQYHAYSQGSLESVNVSAHVMRDADNNIIETYPIDSSVTLRGMLKTDADGNLYYDGDTYEWDGTVKRKWGEVTFNGSENWVAYDIYNGFWVSLPAMKSGSYLDGKTNYLTVNNAFTQTGVVLGAGNSIVYCTHITDTISGVTDLASWKTYLSNHPLTLVYELATSTTETADPYTNPQVCDPDGTEEWTDYGVSQGTRDYAVPVGHESTYAMAYPIEGVDSFTVTANDGTTHTYPVTLSEEIYRGYVDMLTGEAVSDMASISEYNGETISEPWLSSLDVYSAGATPTNGAQVVYPITPEEVTATITGDPSELSGVVSATSTEGTVEWSELSEIGIKCIMKRKNPFQ